MIYQKIDFADFKRAFEEHGREGHFPNTLEYLFGYLEEGYHGGIGLELDVIALCCEFTEYDIEGLREDYKEAVSLINIPGYSESELYNDADFLDYCSNQLNLIDCNNGYYLVGE